MPPSIYFILHILNNYYYNFNKSQLFIKQSFGNAIVPSYYLLLLSCKSLLIFFYYLRHTTVPNVHC